MASYSWVAGTGNWNTANKWSPAGGPPTSASQATISATGSNYAVTVNSADVANSLILSSANATINDTGTSAAAASLTIGTTAGLSAGTIIIGAYGTMSVGGAFTMTGGKINVNGGTLSLGSTLSQNSGTITVNSGGTISGGALTDSGGVVTLNAGGTIANSTVDVTGGTFNWGGGTLSGTKFEGTLSLTAANSYGHVANGLTMAGANGTGAGAINVTGQNGTLYLDGTETLDNATITLGNGKINHDYLYSYDSTGSGAVLTLGPGVTINLTAGSQQIYDSGAAGDGVVNQGVINDTSYPSYPSSNSPGNVYLPTGYVAITGNSFTNQGTINVAYSQWAISSTNFSNTGTIAISNGGRVLFNDASFANTGTITVDGTSTFGFSETLTLAQLTALLSTVSMATGATTYIQTLNNAGTTIVWQAGMHYEGTIDGGVIDGAVDLSENFATLHLGGGVVVNNAAGTGPGAINATGYDSYVYFDGTQTVSNLTITLGNSDNYAVLNSYDTSGTGAVLTLASSVTTSTTGFAIIGDDGHAGDGVINQGVIDCSSGGLDVVGNSFANQGTINVDNRQTLGIDSASFSNTGEITISGGSQVNITSASFANSGTITIDGASSLVLDLTLTIAQLGTINAATGASIYIQTLNNAGATFSWDAPFYAGTVDGGAIDGLIDLSSKNASLHLGGGGVIVNNAAGTGPGAINLTGASSELYFDGTQTVDDLTITLGNSGGFTSYLNSSDLTGLGAVLTLGSGATVNVVGYSEIYDSGNDGDAVVNQGVINDIGNASAGYLYIAGRSFTNQGVINLGQILDIGATTFVNSGRLVGFGTVTATSFANSGTIEASGGTLTLTNAITGAGALQVDASADLVVGGAIASGATATFKGANATLTLDQPASFGATIGGFGELDAIVLKGVTGDAASVNGLDQLVVTQGGTTVATLQLDGPYSGFHFFTEGVSGGTEVLALAPTPPTVAEYLQAVSFYDQIPGGFSIGDTAANISAALDQLADANIQVITVSDNNPVGASVAQLSSDATAIGKLANQDGTPYQLAISDTAADVAAALATLTADVSHVASITASGGLVTISAANDLADQAILDKIAGGFAISDSLSAIASNLGAFNADALVAAITGTSGTATLQGGTAIDASAFTLTGAKTTLRVSENLAYAGALTVGAGASLAISSGDALTLSGTTSLSGRVSGLGTLALTGGATSVDAGAALAVSSWTISGAATSVVLNETLAYSRVFSLGAGAVLTLSGGALTLQGVNSFTNASLVGAQSVIDLGAATIAGLTIGGTTSFRDRNQATQDGGSVTIGDASGGAASLGITSTGTYDITDNSGIALGSASAFITNSGLFEKTGGTGTSVIAPKVVNAGSIVVSTGALDFTGAVSGKGTDTISGAATLEFDQAVASSQTVNYVGTGGVLDLTDPAGFHAEIGGFATGDAIDLAGAWQYSKFSENAGGTLGDLTLSSGANRVTLDFLGSFAASDFQISTVAGVTTVAHK